MLRNMLMLWQKKLVMVFVLTAIFIAVSGVQKLFLDKPISPEAEKVMEDRRAKIINGQGTDAFCQGVGDIEGYVFPSSVLAPIIVEGDPIGVVVMSSKEEGKEVGELEMKLATTAASFLAKQMEQ